MQRRAFLATMAGAGYVAGAQDRVRVGVIGCENRAQYLMGEFREAGADLAAVCDVYEPNLAEGVKLAAAGAKSYDDYRRLLEDKSLDAVLIGTPEHWHAQMTVDAVEAGKDVYVEKPLAHTIADGFRMAEAVRRTRRVCQVGTQRRSAELFLEARRVMNSGVAGEVRLVNSWWLNRTEQLDRRPLEGKLDWKQWLGPAPQRELDPLRFFHWQWFYDYSGGMVTQAAHIIDAINMIMGSSYPLSVFCMPGKVNVANSEVPETASMTVQYPDNFLAVFTVSYKAMSYNFMSDQMKQFHGSLARFDVGREAFALYPQSNGPDMRPSQTMSRPGSFNQSTGAHVRNFLECVVSRREPNATVEMGQAANVSLCMAVQSMRTGRHLKWNATARVAQEV
jgi:predicted dehydrogenase